MQEKENYQNILEKSTLQQALRLASKLIKSGSRSEAEKIYTAILKKFPKNKAALTGLSNFKVSSEERDSIIRLK